MPPNERVPSSRRHAWRGLLSCLLLAVGACELREAAGAPVYRCVDAAGRVTFRDTSCGALAGDRLELPESVPGKVPPAVRELVAHYEASRAQRARPTRTSRAPRRSAQRAAYRCTTAGGEVSFRTGPCPKPRAARGKPAPAVLEERITAREACEGRWLLLDPYERDKRGPPDCSSR